MKKSACLVFSVLFLFTAVSCGGQDGTASQTPKSISGAPVSFAVYETADDTTDAFTQSVLDDPLYKIYEQDFFLNDTTDARVTQLYYIHLWQEQTDEACAELETLLTEEDKTAFTKSQQAWQEWMDLNYQVEFAILLDRQYGVSGDRSLYMAEIARQYEARTIRIRYLIHLLRNAKGGQIVSYTEDYVFSPWKDGYAIEKYTGNDRTVYLPTAYDGKKVLCIQHDAFYQCNTVREVVFSDTIECIEGCPFYRCSAIQKVVLNENLVIDENPFFKCLNLKELSINGDNRCLSAVDNVLYNKEMTKLICYPEGRQDKLYVVPESVTCIGEDVFGYQPVNLEELKIHEGVSSLTFWMVFPERIKLIVKKNSSAEAFAKANEYAFAYYD